LWRWLSGVSLGVIDAGQLIGIVLCCADANFSFRADPAPSAAPINAFEISR
jgi:hypothetical protein